MKQRFCKHNRALSGIISIMMALSQLTGITAIGAEVERFECGDYEVAYTVISEWDNYQSVQLKVSNPTDYPVYRWAFKYDAGGVISDIWNAAVVESRNTEYVVSNLGYNNAILPHSSQQFGYTVALTEDGEEPDEFTDCTVLDTVDGDFSVESRVNSKWATGTNSELMITNNSSNHLYGWEFSFDSNVAINSLWNATMLSSENQHYVLRCSNYNSALAPGATVTIGFVTQGEVELTPTNYELSSEILDYSFSDATSDGSYEYTCYNSLLDKDLTFTAWTNDLSTGKKVHLLKDMGRGLQTYDASADTTNKGTVETWTPYISDSGDWSLPEYTNAIAAQYQVAKVYDYFKETHNWVGVDNSDGNKLMNIGVNVPMNNAFAIGDGLVFGPSIDSGKLSYVADFDSVAHEFTHMVTYNKFHSKFGIGLLYEGESGAIDEAYADIFAELADPAYDWRSGVKAADTIKELWNPSMMKCPDTYRGTYWVDPTNMSIDQGGVHQNSLVLSHAAYLMTQDDETSGLNGISKEDLEKIWFGSYEFYNTNHITFCDCANAVSNAAEALYGKDSQIMRKVESCFDAVGLGQREVTLQVMDTFYECIIPRAEVKIGSKDASALIANSNGEVKINVRNGLTGVWLSCTGYSDRFERINISANSNFYRVGMKTLSNKSLHGRLIVTDPSVDRTNFKPYAFIKSLSDVHSFFDTIKFDSDGYFECLDMPAGDYQITFRAYGYRSIIMPVRIRGDEVQDFVIAEMPVAKEKWCLNGTIIDGLTGAPIPGLTVYCYLGDQSNKEQKDIKDYYLLHKFTTDASGKYTTGDWGINNGDRTFFVKDERDGIPEAKRYLPTKVVMTIDDDVIIHGLLRVYTQT